MGWAIIGPPAKHHLNVLFTGGPMMALHLMLAKKLCDFQGIRTSIAKKPYIFMIFQGGPDPLTAPLDLLMKP